MHRPSTRLEQHFQLGLIGYPLEHSLSPKIHKAALKACGLEGDYSLFSISPTDKQGLEELANRVRRGKVHGFNVTIPHKQNVIKFLNELTPTAKAIGAVNTIYLRENKLIGDNTDALGFLSDLNRFLTNRKSEITRHKSAVVLGAGGSARAVVYALSNDDWNVTIAARRIEQAQELAFSFTNYELPITNFANLQSLVSNLTLIVNTTPVGMYPNVYESPLSENISLHQNIMIYDLIYNPRETKLVRDARSQGLQATTGIGMLIEQAALSFEIWTGYNPSREIMRSAIEQFPVINL